MIGANLLLKIVNTDMKKTHVFVKQIHRSLRSEFGSVTKYRCNKLCTGGRHFKRP